MKSRLSLLIIMFLMIIGSGCERSITGTCTECPDDPIIEKEGPGEITVDDDIVCSVIGEETGMITVVVENGYESIRLETEGGDVVMESDGFIPSADQKHVFSAVPVGSYYVVAEKNDKTSRSELITVDECEVEKIPPIARFDWEVDELTVDFDGSESSDEDGTIEKYEWSFGDDSSGQGVTPEHTYAEPGTYEVTLTVTDNDGLTDSVTHKVTVEAKGFGVITEGFSCVDYDGVAVFEIENGFTAYSLENDGSVVKEQSGLDPDDHKHLEFAGLADAKYTLKLERYNHKASREFIIECDKNLSDKFSHEVNYNLNGKERMAVSSSNKRYELISYGELRPILTDQDPEVMSGEFFYYNEKEESEEDFSLEFVCGTDGRKFSTEVIKDKESEDGWTSTKIDLDASMFKSREFCSITAKSVGGGEVVFSTAGKSGVPGKMIFTWKVLVDGSMMKVSTTDFTFTTDIQ